MPAFDQWHPKMINFCFRIKPSSKKSKLLCKYCGCVSYCTSKCQNFDIPDHQEECTALSKLGSLRFFIDDKTRLIYRIWLRLKVIRSAYCSTAHDMTEINYVMLICHHLFQKEAVDDGQLYFEEIPTEPPTNRYFSDLMDRKIIN